MRRSQFGPAGIVELRHLDGDAERIGGDGLQRRNIAIGGLSIDAVRHAQRHGTGQYGPAVH